MPLFAAIFEDRADPEAIRAANEAAHLAWLDRHRAEVRIAGALRPEAGAMPTGGLWIIEAKDMEEARRICEDDPFFRAGLRTGYRLLHWSRGFPKEPVTI
jgi:uncharacterized protein YciI